MVRALSGAEALLTILRTSRWSEDNTIRELTTKLYKKSFKTIERLNFLDKETVQNIRNLYNQFHKNEMTIPEMQEEKNHPEHLNGTDLIKLKKQKEKNKKAQKKDKKKKKKIEVRKVYYMTHTERMKRMITFENGRVKLPKFLKGSQKIDYVMDNFGHFYASNDGEKTNNGKIVKHSSLFSGEAISCAGSITLDNSGKILSVNNDSGHYTPGANELHNVEKALKQYGAKDFKLDLKK